ncbi:MAG: ferritin-like domain-containing protein [Alphaproteobacteria bacterium]|jgi:rubrerythrin|nr:rubrerythrin family protein [Rhodobiaceae bacterium]MBO6542897.1 ferritin-like domain-containing protein [Alphaproteobacteria bacterium]MBO6627176.1 ferritin-like domain-containing protein [Alphaproteobacteria bacterium]MDF1626333.1 ferritin-like domain-containing protein [Parvibaculaceae bacterium]|tara:strand:- start:345 stop:1166 length:822 start_codon:yes stop_codon:yes gene_type:complete
MSDHWTLDDIEWEKFDASKVDPDLLAAIKAAAMVEANAGDYVIYLTNVFADRPDVQAAIKQWGEEEVQHGAALARWSEIADPSFSFEKSFQRFQDIYRIPMDVAESVRGSRAGELIARCVVESGTSSFYTAIKEATEEPVLKQIAQQIAADEFRHYKLFYDTLQSFGDAPSFWERLKVAALRVNEADDDELASAYYAANTIPGDGVPYNRAKFAAAYEARALVLYQRHHTNRLVSMIAKAVGLAPHGRFMRMMEPVVWKIWQRRTRRAQAAAA